MRAIIRQLVAGILLSAPLAVTVSSGGVFAQAEQSGPSQEELKQVALTEQQIEGFIAAQKDINTIVEKLPEGAADKPDPQVMAQLDAVAKRYKFASYAEYNLVAANISLVLAGVDPMTKKYVGPEVVLKKDIAEVQADKKMPAKDKKEALEQLNAALKAVVLVQFPGNIKLVMKNYDKLNEGGPQD